MAASKNFIITMFQKQWDKVPAWRFMQLISNFQSYMGSDCFYMTNEDFIHKLSEYVNDVIREENE